MARKDLLNQSEYWTDKNFPGISFLKADFRNLQYAPHVHNELVIAITEKGAGKSVTKRGADTSTSGQLLVYNPHEPHEGGAVKGFGWQYRAFYIGNTAIDYFSSMLFDGKVQATYFMNNCIQDKELSLAMHRAHSIFEVSKDLVERQSALLEVLAVLYARYGEPRFKPMVTGNEVVPVKAAMDFMRNNYALSISMADLASVAKLSEFHFMRVFHKHTGLTSHAYLTQIRLEASRRLLLTGLSSADTATSVGFFDQSHLVRHFKRVYGITPQQFILAVRGQTVPHEYTE
jgi:AraC-like DNA-binding protein